MIVHFRLAMHAIRAVQVCEVWVGDKMVATIYPDDPYSIRLITAHLDNESGLRGGGLEERRFTFKP